MKVEHNNDIKDDKYLDKKKHKHQNVNKPSDDDSFKKSLNYLFSSASSKKVTLDPGNLSQKSELGSLLGEIDKTVILHKEHNYQNNSFSAKFAENSMGLSNNKDKKDDHKNKKDDKIKDEKVSVKLDANELNIKNDKTKDEELSTELNDSEIVNINTDVNLKAKDTEIKSVYNKHIKPVSHKKNKSSRLKWQEDDLSKKVDSDENLNVTVTKTEGKTKVNKKTNVSDNNLNKVNEDKYWLKENSGTNISRIKQNHKDQIEKVAEQTSENIPLVNNPVNVNNSIDNNAVNNVKVASVSSVEATSGKSGSSNQQFGNNSYGFGQNRQTEKTTSQQVKLPKPFPPAKKPVHIATNLTRIHVDIAKSISEGHDRISVQLRPNNMGRVDVQIDMSENIARVKIVADNHNTLEVLRNDSNSLQQSLEAVGINVESGGMSFEHQESSNFNDNLNYVNEKHTTTEEENDGFINDIPTIDVLEDLRQQQAEERGGLNLNV